MDEFGFTPLEVEQTNTTDLEKREERIIKRLKGKEMFEEIPFLLRIRITQNILDRNISNFLCSSTPHLLSFIDYAEPPRPELMGGFTQTRSLTGIDLDNLDTEIPMTDIVNNI